MSTAQLQLALVELIKSPDAHRGEEIDTFLDNYNLTESEKWQVRGLCGNPTIAKFGRDLREKRYGFGILKSLQFTKKIVDHDRFRKLMFDRFEPLHAEVKEKKIFGAFVKYIHANPEVAEEYGITSLIRDIITYEYNQFVINADDMYKQDWSVPQDSLLNPDCPIIVSNYDNKVMEAIAAIDCECGLTDLEAFKGATKILFLKRVTNVEEEEHVCEQFEIDQSMSNFLTAQLAGESIQDLPDFYGDLVEVGLCRPLN